MKKTILFIILILICSFGASVYGAENANIHLVEPSPLVANELAMLDSLISATKHNLETQKKLRSQIIEYQKAQAAYIMNPDDRDQLVKVIKQAYTVLETIKNNHLSQSFSQEFISELTLFAQVATKKGIPKP